MSAACHQVAGVMKCDRAHRRHALGPVEEGQALLGEQLDPGEPRLPCRGDDAVDPHLTLSDQRQSEVGEGSEVTRRADRALGGDHREDPCGEELEELLHDHRAHPGVALRQGASPEQEHGAHNLVGERLADTRCMRPQEVVLQRLRLGSPDVGRRQGPEPGGDAVDDLLGRQRLVDDRARRGQSLGEVCRRTCPCSAEGHRRHLLRADRPSVDDEGFHGLRR